MSFQQGLQNRVRDPFKLGNPVEKPPKGDSRTRFRTPSPKVRGPHFLWLGLPEPLLGFGKRGLLEKGSFQRSPFSRDSREFRDS